MAANPADIRPSDDEWLSLEKLCAITGDAVETLYNKLGHDRDMPPAYKFARKWRFRKSDVDAWLAQKRYETATFRLKREQHAAA